VRTLEYDKTETAMHAQNFKYVYQTYLNSQLPNWCSPSFIMVNYLITLNLITILLRLHQTTYIKQDLLLCKIIIYPEWKCPWVRFV